VVVVVDVQDEVAEADQYVGTGSGSGQRVGATVDVGDDVDAH